MNDRFKFRAWNKFEQCVDHQHPDNPVIDCATGTCMHFNGFAGGMMEIEDVIIEQCTGERTKGKKLAFEGDIVKVPGYFSGDRFEPESVMVIEWDNASQGECGFYIPDEIQWCDLEIIGNIHENPLKDMPRASADECLPVSKGRGKVGPTSTPPDRPAH